VRIIVSAGLKNRMLCGLLSKTRLPKQRLYLLSRRLHQLRNEALCRPYGSRPSARSPRASRHRAARTKRGKSSAIANGSAVSNQTNAIVEPGCGTSSRRAHSRPSGCGARRAHEPGGGRCGRPGSPPGIPAGPAAIGLDRWPQRADRHPPGLSRRYSQTRSGIGRAYAMLEKSSVPSRHSRAH
jgi:hypothetical protein